MKMEKILCNLFRNICVTQGNYTLTTNIRFSCIAENLALKPFITNRNPRNLEKIRISCKPTGYHLDKPGKTFWHKVLIVQKPRYVIAQVIHNNGHVVIQASSNEWGINKHLYRCGDTNAFINLARVLAERCLQSGINEMINGVNRNSLKQREFLKNFEDAGIALSEPSTYTQLTPWSRKVDEKPWKVHIT